VIALVAASCAGDRPALTSWLAEVWHPMVAVVPTPTTADADTCAKALARLRELGETLLPAPDPDLAEAAESWLRRAESLTFDCASDGPGFDYSSGHDELAGHAAEVAALLDHRS